MWEIKTRGGEVLDRIWNQTSLAQIVERSRLIGALLRENDLVCVRCSNSQARVADFVQWIEDDDTRSEDERIEDEVAEEEKEDRIQRETFEEWGER